MHTEVIEERLNNLLGEVQGINARLDRLNGKVAEQEKWRAEMTAKSEEWEALRISMDRVKEFIDQQKGGRGMLLQIITAIASLGTLAGVVVSILKHS